jgi:hypothetical protein
MEMIPKLKVTSQNPDSKQSTDFLITKIVLKLYGFGDKIGFGMNSCLIQRAFILTSLFEIFLSIQRTKLKNEF